MYIRYQYCGNRRSKNQTRTRGSQARKLQHDEKSDNNKAGYNHLWTQEVNAVYKIELSLDEEWLVNMKAH